MTDQPEDVLTTGPVEPVVLNQYVSWMLAVFGFEAGLSFFTLLKRKIHYRSVVCINLSMHYITLMLSFIFAQRKIGLPSNKCYPKLHRTFLHG